MGQRRSRCWWVFVLVLGMCISAVQPLDAASFVLSDQERDEAIRTGKRSIVNEEFGAEWTVGNGPGQKVTIMTPFHRLALAARNAAFRGQDLKPRDIESLLKDDGRIVLWVTLRGAKADFARFYTPTLVGGQDIKPAFTQNERTAQRQQDGSYSARCMYVFPVQELNPRGKATLIVKDHDEKPVAKFTLDFAVMR